jgi:hypothetical protein
MKPFLLGRKTHDALPLRANHEAAPSLSPLVQPGRGGPVVEVIKEGEKVVRCSCGERIEVECLYPAGG